MLGPPRIFWKAWIVAAGIALVGYFGCKKQKVDDESQKPVIAVSIFPVASLVAQLTDGWANVVTLLPDGASEHAFEMTADQVRQLSRADLLVLVGNGLDSWAVPKPGMTSDSKQPTVLRMGDMIGNLGEEKDLVAHEDPKNGGPNSAAGKTAAPQTAAPQTPPAITATAPDPNLERDAGSRGPPPPPMPDTPVSNNHLWLDPVLAGRFVKVLGSQLSSRYPQHRAEIEKATDKLSAELQEMDQRYRTELSTVRRRELVTFHNAFDLIAHRYGLVIVARLTDIESDPHGGITPASYLAAIKAINKYRLMAIYSEPEFSAQEIASIQRETAVEVLTVDPLGGPLIDGYRTYQEMMLSNLKTLVKGQGLDAFGPVAIPWTPKPTVRSPGTSFDSDLDAPLRTPSTTVHPKSKAGPSLFSDPDLRFPRTGTKTTDPLAPTPAPSHRSPASPFTP